MVDASSGILRRVIDTRVEELGFQVSEHHNLMVQAQLEKKHVTEQNLLNPNLAQKSRILAEALAKDHKIVFKETPFLGPVPDLAAAVKFVNGMPDYGKIDKNQETITKIFDLINNVAGSSLDYFTRVTKLAIEDIENGQAILQKLLSEGLEFDADTKLKARMNNCKLRIELSTKEGSISLNPDPKQEFYRVVVSDNHANKFEFRLYDTTNHREEKPRSQYAYIYDNSAYVDGYMFKSRSIVPDFKQEVPVELKEGGSINRVINKLVLAQDEPLAAN